MATTETHTTYVIKNQYGQFLEFNSYNGLRSWVSEYSEKCVFESQNAATLYCRSLIADAEVHGLEVDYDVFKYNNQIVEMDVTVPDNQRVNYGLPEKPAVAESAASSNGDK